MTVWVISDTHFGHKNCLTFLDPFGQPMRPFASVEEMNETIIARWNDRVKDNDIVYHLGDVAWRDSLECVKRLRGKKYLILGNHDERPTQDYLDVGFIRVMGSKDFSGLLLSHIPLHPNSLFNVVNVHGHIHANGDLGEPYINVSVEATNYSPLSLEEIRGRVQAQKWIVCPKGR